MKKTLLLFIFTFFSISSLHVFGQNSLCDDFSCLNIDKDILFRKDEPSVLIESPSALIEKSKKAKRKIENNGTILSEDCKNPSFYFLSINSNGTYTRKVYSAKSIGLSIEIKRDCDCTNQKVLAMPISFKRGNHLAVTSYSGKTVFMDIGFFSVLSRSDSWCHGLPKEPTKYHTCKICGGNYATQVFRTKTEETTFIEYAKGTCKNGGNHDNRKLGTPKKCAVTKGSNYENDDY